MTTELNNDQLREIITSAVKEALASPEIHCRYAITPGDHAEQHEALKDFMDFVSNVNKIKWKTLQTLVVYAVLALFGLAIFGAAVKLKVMSFFGV